MVFTVSVVAVGCLAVATVLAAEASVEGDLAVVVSAVSAAADSDARNLTECRVRTSDQ